MDQLLQQIGEGYDYVLLDLPPVLAVTDAALLGNLADGVVLVVYSGMVTPEEVQEAKKRLQAGKANILGVVLNGVPRKHSGYGYGYGYYYYDYYDENHVKHTKKKAKSKE